MSENANGAETRILEAFSKFAETSRRGPGSVIGAPGQTPPPDHPFRPAGAPELLCGGAVVITEQAAQSLTASHVPVGTADAFFRFDQRVPEPLMVALSTIMMDELSDGTPQRWLTEEDHPLQALALDRQNKPFDVSVQIRRTVRQPNDVSSDVLEQVAKLRGELLVAVQDEQSLAAQKAVERVGEIPTDLHHERAVRPESDSGASAINPNRKIFEARKRETAALGAGEKLVLGHPLAATIGDSARCMQNLEKVLFTGPKTSDTVTFICD